MDKREVGWGELEDRVEVKEKEDYRVRSKEKKYF